MKSSSATGSPSPLGDDTNAHIVALVGALLPIWARHLGAARSQSEAAVAQMLAAFAEIAPHLQRPSSAEAPGSEPRAAAVERMYMGFQYQDRINQLMALLLEDMNRLASLVSHNTEAKTLLSTDAWLARLESQYAMAEQRGHRAGETGAGDTETVFF